MKTPQQVKRKQVSELFDNVLKSERYSFKPSAIQINESLNQDKTLCSFKYKSKVKNCTEEISINEIQGSGFVDCIFSGLKNKYQSDFNSLENIRLLNLSVRPNFNYKKDSLGTSAQVEVGLKLEIRSSDHAEFYHCSNSLVNSGLAAALEAFEFYINCENCFYKLKHILRDAESRNRFDTVEKCLLGLSSITEFNRYAKKT